MDGGVTLAAAAVVVAAAAAEKSVKSVGVVTVEDIVDDGEFVL